MKYTKVQFKRNGEYSGTEYHYLTNKELDVKVGDIVLVDAKGEISLARVSSFSHINSSVFEIQKMILEVVDVEKLEREKERVSKKKELFDAITERERELQWEKGVEKMILDTSDVELAKLFDEYKTL